MHSRIFTPAIDPGLAADARASERYREALLERPRALGASEAKVA